MSSKWTLRAGSVRWKSSRTAKRSFRIVDLLESLKLRPLSLQSASRRSESACGRTTTLTKSYQLIIARMVRESRVEDLRVTRRVDLLLLVGLFAMLAALLVAGAKLTV